MNAVLSIARRELDAYFSTAVGWLCLLGPLVGVSVPLALATG